MLWFKRRKKPEDGQKVMTGRAGSEGNGSKVVEILPDGRVKLELHITVNRNDILELQEAPDGAVRIHLLNPRELSRVRPLLASYKRRPKATEPSAEPIHAESGANMKEAETA